MMKTSLAVLVVIAASAPAYAGGQAGSIGVGAEYELNGMGGASLNYDAGQFHVGGFLGYFNPQGGGNDIFEIGGRFFYHMHSTAMSDFSLGGGLGIESVPAAGPMTTSRATLVFLEPSFQIRLFLASNVALSFVGGLWIGLVDADQYGFALGAQSVGSTGLAFAGGGGALFGGAGVHYYFF
jgi:hypothetical protein